MVKVLRCPACGALWRLKADQKADFLRCSECHSVFPEEKAESVEVKEALLDARLHQERTDEDILQRKSEEADIAMSRLAQELSDFESGQTPETAGTPNAVQRTERVDEEMPVTDIRQPEPKKSSPLWGLLFLAALLLLCAAGLLFGHKTVLTAVPQVRSLYENVCTKIPCPGFIWQQSNAFTIKASIAAPDATTNELDREMAGIMPVVVADIKNRSLHPQYLPILELKLLDAAGETMAQRILEPSEYGFAKDAVLAPEDSVSARLSILTPLPYQASDVLVSPVGDLR